MIKTTSFEMVFINVVDLKNYFENLRARIAENLPDFGDSDSVLALRYEAYNEIHNMDDAQMPERLCSSSAEIP